MRNALYETTMKVVRTGAGGGAYVACYAAGPDHETAIRAGVAKLAGLGFRFDAFVGPVREIDPSRWNDYVTKVWPDLEASMPTGNEISAIIAGGGSFFGPFSTFTDETTLSLS